MGSDANTSLIGLLIGLSVFSVSFAAIVQVSTDDAQLSSLGGGRSQYEVLANSLLDQLLKPGQGWYDGAACIDTTLDASAFDPETVTLVGLAEETCVNPSGIGSRVANLSHAKIENLGQAAMDANGTNGALDYEEARAALGYDASSLNFHLRTWPLLDDTETKLARGVKDADMRPLYIGDYAPFTLPGAPAKVVHVDAGAIDHGLDNVTLYLHLTNNGTTDAAFSILLTFPLSNATVDVNLHTPLVAAGQSFNVTYQVLKTADWQWSDETIRSVGYQVADKDGAFQSGRIALPFTMTHTQARPNVFVEAERLWYTPDPSDRHGRTEIRFYYEAWTGAGDPAAPTDWVLDLYDPAGTLADTLRPRGRDRNHVSDDVTTLGAWTAKLRDRSGTRIWNEDRTSLLAADPGAFTPGLVVVPVVPNPAVAPEATYLDRLVQAFEPAVSSATQASSSVPYAADGDVYLDQTLSLEQQMLPRILDEEGNATLANYNVIVVGTGVDQTQLVPNGIQEPIAEWVAAGGMLIVLGTNATSDDWLRPIYHAGLQTASSGLSVPDQNHPILRTPNRLDVTSYDPHGMAWNFDAEQAALFTHVVKSGTDDRLAISNPGAVGLGRVVLTSWWPFDPVYGDIPLECEPVTLSAECPGLQMMDNFLNMGYVDLYLDYGPTIPEDALLGSQSRIVTVWHPRLLQVIEIQLVVYVWD